jgi:hypothetical protein
LTTPSHVQQFEPCCLKGKVIFQRGKKVCFHLPACRVPPEVGEGGGEPVVDLVQRQLLVRGLLNGLSHKKHSHGVAQGRQKATYDPAVVSYNAGVAKIYSITGPFKNK